MHEFSICQSIVEAVLSEMGKVRPAPTRLLKTRVVVGGMRQVVPENMRQAYEIMTKDTAAEGSALEIEVIPIKGVCEKCGWHGEMPKNGFECLNCGSPNARLTGGMELYLDSLELEQEDEGE